MKQRKPMRCVTVAVQGEDTRNIHDALTVSWRRKR